MKYNRLTCFLTGLVLLILFLLLSTAVYMDLNWVQTLDILGDQWLRVGISDRFTSFFHEITMLAETGIIALFSVILLLILFIYKKGIVSTWTLGTIIICGMLTPQLLEILVLREQPDYGLIYAGGYSFPSGHATMATVFYGITLMWTLNFVKDGWLKQIIVIMMPILIILIAWSRVYLGVHYLSDVIGGLLLGSGQLLIATSLYWKYQERPRG